MIPPKSHHLILIHHDGSQERRDFEEIAAKIGTIEPGIAVHIVEHDQTVETSGLPPGIWAQPVLTVALRGPGKFAPKGGAGFCGRRVVKLAQLQRYERAGVPHPPAALHRFGAVLERSEWGDFVVMKPNGGLIGSNGRGTILVRTERAAELADRIYPPGHPARHAGVIVQRFIDTGEHPANYRVLCLFGEPLLAMEYRLHAPRPPLDAPDDVLLQATIASNAEGLYSHALAAPPDVLDFARRTAAAMPRIPLQGIDLVREAGTGKLFALESNPGGNTWHFSSKMSEEGRREITREQRIAQLGAWDVAARVLAARTLRHASIGLPKNGGEVRA